jgi:hypothetical protein
MTTNYIPAKQIAAWQKKGFDHNVSYYEEAGLSLFRYKDILTIHLQVEQPKEADPFVLGDEVTLNLEQCRQLREVLDVAISELESR